MAYAYEVLAELWVEESITNIRWVTEGLPQKSTIHNQNHSSRCTYARPTESQPDKTCHSRIIWRVEGHGRIMSQVCVRFQAMWNLRIIINVMALRIQAR